MAFAQHILVPVDFSQAAELAAAAARVIALQNGASVTLVHAFDPTPLAPIPTRPLGVDGLMVEADVERRIHRSLEEVGERHFEGLEFRVALVLAKNAAQGICDYAAKENMDLIVISTHGRTGLKHMLIGSVAERVVRHAPCPVLTLRSKAHE
jgi:nucleotide-binding universal stress UspA family protein